MKKIVLAALMLLPLAISASNLDWWPQQNWKTKPWFVGISFNTAFTSINLEKSSPVMLGIDMLMSGIYVGYSSNLDYAKESKWGAGKTIDDHHLVDCISAGYNYMYYSDDRGLKLGVMPYVSFLTVRTRYSDAYYGKDKNISKDTNVGFGLGLTLSKITYQAYSKLAQI